MYKSIVSILFFVLSCTPKTEKPVSVEKPEPEVLVKIESRILQGADKVEARYELTENDCRVAWQTNSEKKDQVLEVHLKNRTECKLPFNQAASLHEKVLSRILKDYAATNIKSISTNGLKSLQPDGSWNLIVAKAAEQSADYQDFRKNYPKHKSQKSTNRILVDLIHQTQVHAPFKEMLAKLNLHFELESVEKVFQTQDGQIDDAGAFWWRPTQK
ncbi:hypothetical protein [Bdellovibrio sp. HCB337]|uniref:hypothetical protein n=1 Tax=Bdellovibrio sp. HCB337 TaxID=3394358 RepID=UPI0039A4CCC7